MRKIEELALPTTQGGQGQSFELDEWLYLPSSATYEQGDAMLEDRFVQGIEEIQRQLSSSGEATIYDESGERNLRGGSLVLVTTPFRQHDVDKDGRRVRLTVELAVVS